MVALDGVDLDLASGEIHALLGENGAGKTTLLSIVAGLLAADSGAIRVDGAPVSIRSPREAREIGIGMVHQRFRLSERHTVLENVLLAGRDLPFFRTRRTGAGAVRRAMEGVGLEIDLERTVGDLSIGERQRVEIVRALYAGARILFLDEPTAVLGPEESSELFLVLRRMAASGLSIVFVSHKMKEVLALSDRVSVLSRGRKVATRARAECDESALAELMIGRALPPSRPRRGARPGRPVLEIRSLVARSDRGHPAVNGLDLVVRSGEIHGVAGVAGNGQTELAEVLAGLRALESGRILVAGRDEDRADPALRLERGIRFVPADARGTGSAPGLSIAENLLLRHHRGPRFGRFGFLRPAAILSHARAVIARHAIAAPSPRTLAGVLSGGNLQKVILARETDGEFSLLVALYPTHGLDVAAVRAVHDLLRAEADRGAAVLLFGEDLTELLEVSDAVSVIYEGRITLGGPADELDRDALRLALSGRVRA